MMNLRKLTVLAITALLVTGISGLSTVAGMPKSETTSTPLVNPITALINTVGDDLFSTLDLTTLVDPTTTSAPTQHYGPYSSDSPDSGTCGNDWATDTFDRHFTVKSNQDGTFTVIEQFKDGSFVTNVGRSPGACETSPLGTATVNGGLVGTMHGYFIIPLPTGT